jgi:hypothetical protein
VVVPGIGRETTVPAPADCQLQVQRILQSAAFRNALTLQQLLQFLTQRSFDGSIEPLKEYTIGIEAFGRSQDFDPRTDTIVRVQIHRLRQKLKEYYDSDGSKDPIVVEIPKGHYLPHFELMSDSETFPDKQRRNSAESEADESVTTPVAAPYSINLKSRRLLVLAAGMAIAVFAAGFWLGSFRKAGPSKQSSDGASRGIAPPDSVKMFWASFAGDDQTPIIAYPDAVFLLDATNDLFRFRHGASDDRGSLVEPHLAREFASNPKLVSEAGDLYYENGYTGTGELQAVAMLCSIFGQMGIRPILKPSRDLTPVDLRQHSIILLGSSFQNLAVGQLMTAGDFSFKNPDAHLEEWRAEIVNAQPRVGEQSAYHTERDASTHVLEADYGIFSIQAIVPGRYVVMLGGLDTTGTEGATMYATSKSSVEELEKILGVVLQRGQDNELPQFQALVHVGLEKGYEVLGANLVAVHKITPARGRSENEPIPSGSHR